MTRKPCPNRQIGTAFDQKPGYRPAYTIGLAHCMEDGGLASDCAIVNHRPRIDISAAIQEEPDGFEVAIFRCHMKWCRTF